MLALKNRKIENRKFENRKESEKIEKSKKKNWKIENFSKSGPNHGANERPKGEPVAVGDLKASSSKVPLSYEGLHLL